MFFGQATSVVVPGAIQVPNFNIGDNARSSLSTQSCHSPNRLEEATVQGLTPK